VTGRIGELLASRGAMYAEVDGRRRLHAPETGFWEYLGVAPGGAPHLEDVFPELVGLEGEIDRVLTLGVGEVRIPAVHRAEPRAVYFDLTLLPYPEGAAAGLLVLQDETERREGERELAQSRNELALLRRRLEEDNALLQNLASHLRSLNDQKNRFVGIAAHDLRNPLTAIIGFGEFLRSGGAGELAEDQHKMVDGIVKSGEYMLRLVEDLLDVSAIESGNLSIDASRFDLRALAEECLSLNGPVASRKGIALRLEAPPEEVWVTADRVKLEQVANNLVSNAIKYSNAGASVELSVEPREADVLVSVSDQGIGIPAESLGSVFQPFGRAHRRGTAGEKAVGLGLAISKNIVERHGGTIRVDSTVGVGSVFRFTVPRTPAAARPAPGPSARA
jgi:signal transduction histidine kinase